MAFIRRVPTASGATAVQIMQYVGGRQRVIKHVGSAHTEAELGVLLGKARELLEDPAQGLLDLDVEPTLPVARLVTQPAEPALFKIGEAPAAEVGRDGPGRVVDTDCRLLFEALAAVYADLGFDVLGDEVFRDLVIARVVEPTSLLDMGRVLTELGRSPASYSTMRRTLVRAEERGYRDRVATACFAHAASTGDVSLILYDVTVRREALVVRAEVRDLCLIPCRSRGFEAGGSLTGETSGRAGAAPTKSCRVSTVGWRGCGEHAEEVYARNRCHHLS
nr:hypothetical protein [Intrasporangium calvum]